MKQSYLTYFMGVNMQNRNEKQEKRAGYAVAGALAGTAIWGQLHYLPNKEIIERYKAYSDHRAYHFHYAPKVVAGYSRMVKGSVIIPISAAAFYLMGCSASFFAKSQRKNELSKVEDDKNNKGFKR